MRDYGVVRTLSSVLDNIPAPSRVSRRAKRRLRVDWQRAGMSDPPACLLRPLLTFALAALAGCATFHPLPLDSSRGLRQVRDVTVPAQPMPARALRTHPFD